MSREQSRYPPNFETWPRGQQIEHVAIRHTRRGLIAACLSHAGEEPRSYPDRKLRKKELAAVLLTLEGYPNAE